MENITTKISLDLIDDPKLAMRSDVRKSNLEELAADMKAVGLIEPIVVRQNGKRYEIIAGHRRTQAARYLNWGMIEAKIVEVDDEKALSMRLIENSSREDVDPVDESLFIMDIMEHHKKSIDDICQMMKRSKAWVVSRLEVSQMPDYMQDYLQKKMLSLAAAIELNKIENEKDKRYYTNYAAVQGSKVNTVKQWRATLMSKTGLSDGESVILDVANQEVEYKRQQVVCEKCGKPVYLDEARMVYIHENCDDAVGDGGK